MKKNQLEEINKMSEKLPKTIKEAINFEREPNEMHADLSSDEKMPYHEEKPIEEKGMDVDKFLDDIRKQSLKGMAQLADNPLSEQYQTLKKVWQIVDKAAEIKQNGGQNQNVQKQF